MNTAADRSSHVNPSPAPARVATDSAADHRAEAIRLIDAMTQPALVLTRLIRRPTLDPHALFVCWLAFQAAFPRYANSIAIQIDYLGLPRKWTRGRISPAPSAAETSRDRQQVTLQLIHDFTRPYRELRVLVRRQRNFKTSHFMTIWDRIENVQQYARTLEYLIAELCPAQIEQFYTNPEAFTTTTADSC